MCANAGPLLGHRWANVGPLLGQRWSNVVPTLSCQRWDNIGPTLNLGQYHIPRAGLRMMGALGMQQELGPGPKSRQARTVTPAGPRASIVFVEHLAISDSLA